MMKFQVSNPKVLVVHKRTIFEDFVLKRPSHRLARLFRAGHESTAGLEESYKQHARSLESILDFLKKSRIDFDLKDSRSAKKVKNYDLIVTVGGDGTFLRMAHKSGSTPILGVNSAPLASVGALCRANLRNFQWKFKAILTGKAHLMPLHRLAIKINGKLLPKRALNDILFANLASAGTSRYLIEVGSRKESQVSSGVWIATPTGSTAAIHAAGGKLIPLHSKKFQYLVREPFYKKFRTYGNLKGVLSSRGRIVLISQTLHSCLSLDGTQSVFPVQFGDEIEIFLSEKPLFCIQ